MKVNSPTESGLLCIGLNQDKSCFSCGYQNGVRIYNCEPLKQLHKHNFNKGVGYVEMLFRCCYLALVGGGDDPAFPPNKVIVWEDEIQKIACEIEVKSDVLAVKLKRDRIVIVLLEEVYVYTFEPEPKVLFSFSTCSNPTALTDMSTTTPLLVIPSIDKGQICLINIGDDYPNSQMRLIPAHTSKLALLNLNMQGTMVATASEKGTLIRIFDTHTCLLLYELRRGTQYARIYSVAFNQLSTKVCVTSDTKTVHIFSLDSKQKTRAITKYTLPSASPSICCFGEEENTIIIVTIAGFYFKIRWNPKGESIKEEQFKFTAMMDD